LNISYQKDGKKEIPWGLNCTAVTFRSGLAILEQFQQADGRVKLPEVLVEDFGKEFIG
jgi:seryl-tRNA synthetase